jgi:hypothetical protein
MKKFFKVLAIIIGSVVALFILFEILDIFYPSIHVQTFQQGGLITYSDKEFSYDFKYPATWTRDNPTALKGYVRLQPAKNSKTSVEFWYKDSKKITNYDELLAFVKDDASYAQKEQGITTISIEKSRLGIYDAVLWTSKDLQGKTLQTYYVTTPTITSDQLIFVWIANVDLEDQAYKDQVDSILSSYRLE